jgi:hypothetical protein
MESGAVPRSARAGCLQRWVLHVLTAEPRVTELLLKIERLLHLLSKSDRDNRQTSFQKPLKRILELANDVFGFDGWATEILSNEITVVGVSLPSCPTPSA